MWRARSRGTIFISVADRPKTWFISLRKRFLVGISFLALSATVSLAQVLQHARPTERLIKCYEKLVAEGSLLTPEGWSRASKLFARPGPYPAHSDIQLISSPGIIGETRLDGDRAQVDTKWGDYYGTIDSLLQFKGLSEYGGSVMLAESFSLLYIHQPRADGGSPSSDAGEWKIDEAGSVRAASIPAAIKYLEDRRNASKDPTLRRNAGKTIDALKHLHSGCGVPNPC